MAIQKREKGFRKLLVWEKAHELVLGVYTATKAFPKEERFGLTSQLQRAAVSIPSNIAEGHALESDPQFLRHLRIARGSLAEVEYQLLLAADLELLSEQNYDKLENKRREVGYLLYRLMTAVKKRGS
ncbi:MAG: hypothetical protein B6I38_07270 [Anaerolineaceae bacterium 4572_5.1]|nr:MAG: hypothetical protein B6I38_07270 [Anaerolineaceae bacterium 4572_5.1]